MSGPGKRSTRSSRTPKRKRDDAKSVMEPADSPAISRAKEDKPSAAKRRKIASPSLLASSSSVGVPEEVERERKNVSNETANPKTLTNSASAELDLKAFLSPIQALRSQLVDVLGKLPTIRSQPWGRLYPQFPSVRFDSLPQTLISSTKPSISYLR